MKHRRALLVAATLASILGASHVTAQAPKSPAPASNVIMDIEATSPSDLSVFVTQTWEGEAAKRMRQSLDVYFGAADGTLTPSELDRIARATEADMRENPITWLRVAGQPFTVVNVTVSFGNATGPVQDFRPLTMIHDLTLTAAPPPAAAPAELRFDPQWNGTFSFRSPEGSHVANATGLADLSSDENATRGRFAAGQGVALLIAAGAPPEPTAEVDSDAGSDAEAAGPAESTGRRSVPAISLGVVAAGAGAALLALVVRRRRNER